MILPYVVLMTFLFLIEAGKKLSITSISTLHTTSTSNVLYGSSQGGTLLYIKGTGFQQNPSLNSVMIGPYPCLIPDEGLKE